ncbi:MAG: hypothetical protein ACI37J_09945 [Candidatus Bruticola sp.]
MIISNHSLDNVALRLSPLPPQRQNLAPPPLEATDIRDSVLLSREEQSREQTLQASPPPLTELSSDNSQNTTEASEPNQVKTEQKHLPTEEREPQCRSRPESYSAATSTDCAFSSEAAPALLFQEDFYTTWPLSAWPPSETNASSSQAESTETNSAAEPLQPTFAQLEEPHTTEETNKAEVNGTANSIAIESSSSTRSKAEAKKTPSAEGPPSQAEEQALKEEKEQQEKQRVEVIYDRIKAEKLLHEAKRQAIWADLQTELRRIWREVMLRRKKSEDDYQKNWQKIFLNAG